MSTENVDKKQLKYQLLNFKSMCKKILKYLEEEDLAFSMLGYTNVMNDYLKFVDNYVDDIAYLIRNLNLWLNLLSDMEGFIEFKFLESELELDIAIAKNYKPETEYYEKLRKRKVHFKEFLRQVKVQRKIFLNANWHCSKEFTQTIGKNVF